MKYTHTITFTLLIGALVLTQGGVASYAYAHEGEEHETEAEAKQHEVLTLTVPQMEDFILKLRQIIQLLTVRNQLLQQISAPVHVEVEHVHTEDSMHDDADMDEHMEEHSTPTTTSDISRLIIELEEHNGKTHVHVRYTDKPEDMFFVDAALTNIESVIAEIKAKTGLTEVEIKAAITYPGL